MTIALGETPRPFVLGSAFRNWMIMSLIMGGLSLAILYPVYLIFYEGFFEGNGLNAETLEELFTSRRISQAFFNTFAICFIGLGIAGFIGISLAWLVARTNMPLKRFFDPANIIPFYLSSVVGALSWQVIAAPNAGLINTWIGIPLFGAPIVNIYSLTGIGFVLGLYYAPFIYIFTLGSLQSMDASLEEASRISGASNLKTALKITIPLSAPAIIASSILVFVNVMSTFGVPLLLGVPGRVHTFSTLMFRYINDYPPDFATTAIIGTVLLVSTAALTGAQMWYLRSRKFTTVTGKGYRPRTVDLGRWRWPAASFNIMFLALVLLPFVALIMVSFQNAWTGAFEWGRVTFSNYYTVLFIDETARRGLKNSMIISTIGATLGVFLCMMLALVVHRTRLPGRDVVGGVVMVPVAVPGVVFGVGLLLAVIGSPLYATIWILMIAYIIEFLPTGYRNSESVVLSFSKELDESARVSGASWWQAMTRIILPLAAPGMASLWILMFVVFIREVSASIMLYTYGTETMSIALIRIMEYEAPGVSSAFGVLQTIMLLAFVAMLRAIPTGQTKSAA